MYYTKITFTPLEKLEITEDNVEDMDITSAIWGYTGDLLRNGQIYQNDKVLIHNDNVFQAFFFMPELDSLDEKYCNEYVNGSFIRIKERCEIAVEVLGRNTIVNPVCSCNDSSWYILYALKKDAFSPIVCGDCLKMIPTYKLPKMEIPAHIQSEIGWLADYYLIDQLWMYCGFDRFTYRQMSDIKSTLSKSGREICSAYENAIGKPFYYFLYYHSNSKKIWKTCPDCGGEWKLKDNIGNLSFKCDICRLVSYG